jgi:hypothetical protein
MRLLRLGFPKPLGEVEFDVFLRLPSKGRLIQGTSPHSHMTGFDRKEYVIDNSQG